MIEVVTLEEATADKLTAAHVVMTVGYGDPQAPRVLFGRENFASAASSKAKAEETNILRVKVANDDEFAELKGRVTEAKGELDPNEA